MTKLIRVFLDTSIDSRSVLARFTTFIISARQCDPSSCPFLCLLFGCAFWAVATIQIGSLIVVFHNYILFAWPFGGWASPISLMPRWRTRAHFLLLTAAPHSSVLSALPSLIYSSSLSAEPSSWADWMQSNLFELPVSSSAALWLYFVGRIRSDCASERRLCACAWLKKNALNGGRRGGVLTLNYRPLVRVN